MYSFQHQSQDTACRAENRRNDSKKSKRVFASVGTQRFVDVIWLKETRALNKG